MPSSTRMCLANWRTSMMCIVTITMCTIIRRKIESRCMGKGARVSWMLHRICQELQLRPEGNDFIMKYIVEKYLGSLGV